MSTIRTGKSHVRANKGEPAAGAQKERTFDITVRKRLQADYLLYLPPDYDKDKNKRWPLVLFLHGAGERGSDVSKVSSHGPPMLAAGGEQFPFILVSPQCPEGSWWDSQIETLTGLLEEIESDYRVDVNRIYLTGLSMGGFGTWMLATKFPDRFAAIAPICGGGIPFSAPLIKDVPMWVFHGEQDGIVPVEKSKEMVNAVSAAGGNPIFTVYSEVGHDSWTITYNNSEFWDWLLDQRKR